MTRNGEDGNAGLSDTRQWRAEQDAEKRESEAYSSSSEDIRQYPGDTQAAIKPAGAARFLYPAAVIAAAILLLVMVAL